MAAKWVQKYLFFQLSTKIMMPLARVLKCWNYRKGQSGLISLCFCVGTLNLQSGGDRDEVEGGGGGGRDKGNGIGNGNERVFIDKNNAATRWTTNCAANFDCCIVVAYNHENCNYKLQLGRILQISLCECCKLIFSDATEISLTKIKSTTYSIYFWLNCRFVC